MAPTANSKRPKPTVDVPPPGDDPAERKRILNVLAQRRYRQKRRQRLAELEKAIGFHDVRTHDTTLANTSGGSEMCGNEDITKPNVTAELGYLNPSLDLSRDLIADTTDPGWDTSTLFPSLTTNLDPGTSESHSSPELSTLSNELWSPKSTSTSPSLAKSNFPDEVHLPVLELNLLKAAFAIAYKLQIESIMWDLNAVSPFVGSASIDYSHLPTNIQPTLMQLTVPHHPVLDILPWPTVRDKMIMVFSQPPELRPPSARSETALVELVYDIEDSAEGVRVTGDDPFAPKNWEIGQKAFGRWWWAFSREIVNHSNKVRENRGATMLRGMVLGEVT